MRSNKLIMTLLVRDEEDIVRQNIDYHLDRGVDFIIVTDNGSTDGTVEILEEYEKTGVLRLLHESDQDFDQAAWVTRMALMAREEYEAKFVINSDADEFWMAKNDSLKENVDRWITDMVSVDRYNLIYPHDLSEPKPWYQKVIFKVVKKHRAQDLSNFLEDRINIPYLLWNLSPKAICKTEGLLSVDHGNHSANYTRPSTVSAGENLAIYHFPFRGREKFIKNCLSIGRGLSRNAVSLDAENRTGWHRRRWYNMILNGLEERVFEEVVPNKKELFRLLRRGEVRKDKSLSKELKKIKKHNEPDK